MTTSRLHPRHTVAELGPTLAWSTMPIYDPPLVHYDGRALRWDDWEIGIQPLCRALELACGTCGWDGQPWDRWAIADPMPGETVTAHKVRHTRSGREYLTAVEVPAWPIRRLYQRMCPVCRTCEIYDRGQDGATWQQINPQQALF